MPIPEISLAQFNRIASGKYNAGFVDFQTDANGNVLNELTKVNNHVHKTSKNTTELTPERILEVKEAFIAALERANVPPATIDHIRERLGIPTEYTATGDTSELKTILKTRFKPLTRMHIRNLLDKYANKGLGFTDPSRAAVSAEERQAAERTANMSASNKATRQQVNRTIIDNSGASIDFKLTDVMSTLSMDRSFADMIGAQQRRIKGQGPEAEALRTAVARDFSNSLVTVFSASLGLLAPDTHETAEFTFLGTTVKLCKDEDGNLSAIVGKGVGETKVNLGMKVENWVQRLVGRAIMEKDAIGNSTLREMLNTAYAMDIKNGLMASDRVSLTRNFASLILELQGKTDLAQGESGIVNLARGNYNTGLLVQIAQRSLNGELTGENVIDTKQKLDNYYAQMRKDTAALPDDIKQMLEGVANMPFEPVHDGEFIVRAPIVGNIDQHVNAIPPQDAPAPALPQNVSIADVKDFVADFIFSNDTMVSDVVIDQPGELMRRMLSDSKKLAAFAAIIKNPALLDKAAAPQIADVLKAGFEALKAKLAPAFATANGGQSLEDAIATEGFEERFSAFLRDAQKLPGAVLAEFDDVIDEMASKACVKIQDFINQVFDINAQGGVNVVKDPYAKMSKEQIKAELDGKSLNQILDSAAKSEVPGQIGFFKQVIATYFTSLDQSDKRSCLAAALRYANVFDFPGKQGEELNSAEKVAINKFTGAVLKGGGPLLHKMMQGLPKDIMGPYADALEDMKQNLAPIPRKIVQGYLNQMIAESNGKIQSITLKKSLGAASVGEVFLCEFAIMERIIKRRQATMEEMRQNGGKPWVPVLGEDGQPVYEDKVTTKELVVKIMRHDAERRVEKEAKIFTAAAEKIPGMAKTWEGQLAQYMTEFDFRTEAQNLQQGVELYDIYENQGHPLQAIAPQVTTMKLSPLVPPKKNVMVAEVMGGSTVDAYFKRQTADIRLAASAVFEQDPVTGRIKWETKVDPITNTTKQVPVPKQNIPGLSISNLQNWLGNHYENLAATSDKINQAIKAWFYNAIIGNGKFHGDTHSGNFMSTVHSIGFIDFGNLYTLDKSRADGVNEQQELLRVILGAAFRDKELMLEGIEKLMSDEGKAKLADPTIREKANTILESILSPNRGSFSFNIVYRLQAAIIELQKLGLELPPQINCFIQSMVRFSNTVTEINTIVNQTKALLDATKTLTVPPQQERDELDLIGRIFDSYASEDGQKIVHVRDTNDEADSLELIPPEEQQPDDKKMPAYMLLLQTKEFGGRNKVYSNAFQENGEYYQKVLDRLTTSQDPIAEAEKLTNFIVQHADPEHNIQGEAFMNQALAALNKLRNELQAAGDNAELKTTALQNFASSYTSVQSNTVMTMFLNHQEFLNRDKNPPAPPATFASAITDILFDNFDTVKTGVGNSATSLGGDAVNIAKNELGLGFWQLLSPASIVSAFQEDAKRVGGDNSYKIDIGV